MQTGGAGQRIRWISNTGATEASIGFEVGGSGTNNESQLSFYTQKSAITQLPGWKHIRCKGGINSKEANAYFIFSTLVMILVDTKTNKICAKPENVEQLINTLYKLK